MKLLNRIIQVDHCENYRVPKYKESVPEEIRNIWEEGCAPKPINIPDSKFYFFYKIFIYIHIYSGGQYNFLNLN